MLKKVTIEHQNSLPMVVIFQFPHKRISLTLKYRCTGSAFMPKLRIFVQNKNEVAKMYVCS